MSTAKQIEGKQLEKIVNECRELRARAEKRLVFIGYELAATISDTRQGELERERGLLRAAIAGWQATISAIEWWQRLRAEDRRRLTPYLTTIKPIEQVITHIIAAWPEELL